ncbi:MAG: L-lysine 2,3-aminomutase [Ulvibacter sp.]|jgi:L-lysine 2,3-aminomutase
MFKSKKMKEKMKDKRSQITYLRDKMRIIERIITGGKIFSAKLSRS